LVLAIRFASETRVPFVCITQTIDGYRNFLADVPILDLFQGFP